MKKNKIIISVFSVVSLVFSSFASVTVAGVDPPEVNAVMAIGESIETDKTVTTTAIIPPIIDICLLVDETGSFDDDIGNLKTAAPAIYDDITATGADAQFAVTGFRDYPVPEYGIPGDWVYRLLSPMSPVKANWTVGVNALIAYGGWDLPEAQYDAIVAAAGPGIFTDPTLGDQYDCRWRVDAVGAKRVLIVATDAPFHTPDGTHVKNEGTTITALNAQNITVVGLKAGSAGTELDALAAATGGNVQPLSDDGSNIAEAILAGISLPITVTPNYNCDPLIVTFDPPSHTVISGNPAIFNEKILVPDNPTLAGSLVECVVEFLDENGNSLGNQNISVEIPIAINLNPKTAVNELGIPSQTHTVDALVTSDSPLSSVVIPDALVNFEIISGPNIGKSESLNTDNMGIAKFTFEAEQGVLGLGMDTIEACVSGKDGRVVCDEVTKEWVDTMPPEASCVEAVNPSGKKIPPAGSTTLPGSKGGMNEDGFYQLLGEDYVDPDVEIFIEDTGSGTVFGPFASDVIIKYTEDADVVPEQKKMGSDKGKAGAVAWHIIGNGDMVIYATDSAGNESDHVSCLVPPLPK